MNADLILFGIEAGMKLGQAVNDALVENTLGKPLLMPVGELFGSVQQSDAIDFFDEHPELSGPGKLYHDLSRPAQLKAYRTLMHVDAQVTGSGGVSSEAVVVVTQLHALRQYKKGFGPRHPAQRVIGTVVEIGIDYFVANPDALGKKSSKRKILQAFLEGLDETSFSEGTPVDIIGDVLVSALDTLNSNTSLVADDARLRALIGGVTSALLADIEAAGSVAALKRRENLVQRIGSSLLKGGARAFSENLDLFLSDDKKAKGLVGSTLTHLLKGIKGKENLFTNESLELLFDSALRAVAENADILSDDTILQELIQRTLRVMTDAAGKKVFPQEIVSAVLGEALAVAAENIETLIDPENAEHQLLATATRAVAQSLSGSLAGGGTVKDLLSRRQLVSLMGVVFDEVAKHPEQLIGKAALGDRKAALAQILGSVANALGDDPSRFVNGEGFVMLAEIVLQTAAKNADKLLDLGNTDPKKNILFQVIQQAVAALSEGDEPSKLVNREVFLDITEQILPVVSANLAGLLDAPKAIKETITTALRLTNEDLAGRVNGENLPDLIVGLLSEVLWGELDLEEQGAVLKVATLALKAA